MNESRQKDERIQQLVRDVQSLEERCSEAEQSKFSQFESVEVRYDSLIDFVVVF